jgi:hypothetical protein
MSHSFLRKSNQQMSVRGERAAHTCELELAEQKTAFKIPDRNVRFLPVRSPTGCQAFVVHGAVAPCARNSRLDPALLLVHDERPRGRWMHDAGSRGDE